MLTLTAKNYLKTNVILPYPVVWKDAKATYDCGDQILSVRVPLSKVKSVDAPDVGTRAWNLAEAISGASDAKASGQSERSSARNGGEGNGDDDDAARNAANGNDDDDSRLPEDKFHLNVPKGYNLHSGLRQDEDLEDDGNDTGELPEDKFHRNDIVSQHLIEQQQKERQNKIDKAEKDRLDRKIKKKTKADDQEASDIEYLDVDDFKPGGKYYSGENRVSSSDEPDNSNLSYMFNEDLTNASQIMKDGSTRDSDAGDGEAKAKGDGVKLNSNLWTELLD